MKFTQNNIECKIFMDKFKNDDANEIEKIEKLFEPTEYELMKFLIPKLYRNIKRNKFLAIIDKYGIKWKLKKINWNLINDYFKMWRFVPRRKKIERNKTRKKRNRRKTK
jgi:hypothetical protein